MLILLSPAKKLLKITKPYAAATSQPVFIEKTKILAQLMQSKSIEEIAALMDLSRDLAVLNYERYQHFQLENRENAPHFPALFLFQGDVYQGLQAVSWTQRTVAYSQNHLRILSGLYGLLKPLDRIQPYRLEMGVRLNNPVGKNLYEFWQETVTELVNQELTTQSNPVVVNLASNEYSKVIDEKKLNAPMVTINFYESKNNQLKMVGIHAKKARGVMAKFLLQQQIDGLEQLKEFNELGYQYHQSTSSKKNINFIRKSK